MRKQEWIHFHGLLAEVARYGQRKKDFKPDLSSYEDLGVRPTSVHMGKTDHKEAVFALADAITTCLEYEDPEKISREAKVERGEGRRGGTAAGAQRGSGNIYFNGGSEEVSGEAADLTDIGEELLGDHEEVMEQEDDPVEMRHLEEEDEAAEREEAEYYEGW